MADDLEASHLLIRNIPQDYHSSDLRRFFSEFVETNRFECFHFRHRPEIKIDRNIKDGDEAKQRSTTRCCVVRAKATHVPGIIQRYSGTHWTNANGEDMESKCFVVKVKVSGRGEEREPSEEHSGGGGGVALSERDLETILELKPPGVMPRGNVGTSTEFFLRAIQQCKLPTKIIAKLKLEFPRSRRRRKYGNVEYSYEREDGEREERLKRRAAPAAEGGKGKFLDREKMSQLNSAGPSCEGAKVSDHSDDDDDTCEEWERHEALHNDMEARRADPRHGHMDISQQPGTKERLFEEEMEVTWDKGSSGLVFYTDAQVWKEAEGDFDERTTDDWDVDMSVYYDEAGGDKDARDALGMRNAERNYKGKSLGSVFGKSSGNPAAGRRRDRRGDDDGPAAGGSSHGGKIGKFERHTKGFGRRIMERQGWREGRGLGTAANTGMAEALENDGQADRAGLGYHGERITTFVAKPTPGRKRTSIRDVMITTGTKMCILISHKISRLN